MNLSIPFFVLAIIVGVLLFFLTRQNKKIIELLNRNKELLKSKESAIEYIDALWSNQQSMILEEKLSSLSSLVAGVAHELNTPLGVSLTALTYFEDTILDDDLKPMLDQAKNNLIKSINLVEKFTEISGGDINEPAKPIKFKEFLDYTSCLLKSPVAIRNIRNLVINADSELIINVSESSLSIVLKNILENAFDFAFKDNPQGQVTLNAEIQDKDLLITVKDNGQGLTEKEIQHIFDPFYTTRRSEGHYGLGLAICYNLLARQHNGTLSCKSEVGEGSEFTIKIPRVVHTD
jgi:signal transduction histidine kinase